MTGGNDRPLERGTADAGPAGEAGDLSAGAILHALCQSRGLPHQALAAASARRDEMLPLFLAEIEAVLAAPHDTDVTESPVFYIFHLLGEWRAAAAYRPLARLLRLPTDLLDAVLGDALTETAPRVMASVFDGDPQPLFDIVLDPEAEGFARDAMCEAIAILVRRGDLDRAVAARFFRDGFMTIEPQAMSTVWYGWQSAIAGLGLTELTPLVRKAFARGFIDETLADFDDYESDLRGALLRARDPTPEQDRHDMLFGETALELAAHGFDQDLEDEEDLWSGDIDDEDLAAEIAEYESAFGPLLPSAINPARNPFRDVGRNDPCPCGSGKKYKKCCLA